MFKSILIVFLVIALAVAAFVTRPSEQSAQMFLQAGVQPSAAAPKTFAVAVKDAILKAAEPGQPSLPDGYEFHDRVLWVEVVKNGQTVYTGVLSHWIKHDPVPAVVAPAAGAGPVVAAQIHR